jgi:hypothetical protein
MSVKDTLADARKKKKVRMGVIIGLMALVVILMLVLKKGTVAFTVILVLLAVALGLEGFNYDVDVQKLWETGNYQESRVESVTDKDGNTVRLIGECVKSDVNCDNFKTQTEAQNVYDTCADEIAQNNSNIGDVKSLDIYGLDRDKDGIVCESLPAGI